MPDAIITSTASTFGTISGTFAADQSTIVGTVKGGITGNISGSVGVPGPVGPAGPGSTWGGIAGVLSNQTDLWSELGSKYPASNPSGFITASALSPYLTTATANATFQTLAGMSSYLTTSAAAAGYYPLSGNPSGFLTSASLSGYATESWVTGQGYITSAALTPYLTKADNLASVASVSAARDNLGLGSLSTPTFAGVTVQGSGANVANLTPTSLSLTHATSGSFTIQPSVGITFPDASVQTTAYTGSTPDYITSVSSPLSVTSGNLSVDLSSYLLSSTASATYQTLAGMSDYLSKAGNLSGLASTSTARTNLGLGSLAVVNDAPSDGSQYARKNAAWEVVIAGDRYLTSSTTSNTVSNGTKSFTIGTGLSYTPTQNITISYDASNHMHGEVLTYNSGTGALSVDVNHHTGSGTYAAWVVNVGGVTPATSVAWGAITGTISAQTDLQGQLDAKLAVTTAASTYYLQTNPAGYIDSSALTGYATESWVTSQGYLTSSALTGYATESWVTSQGYLTSSALTGYATESWVTSQGYLTSASLSGYATESWVTSGFYPLTGNPSGFITSAALSGYAPLASPGLTGNVTITSNSTSPALVITQDGTGDIVQFKDVTSDTTYSFIDASGKVGTIASTTANAGFNIAHGAAPTTPVNGDIWTTTSGLFMRQNGSTKQYVDFDGTQTINGSKTFSGASQTLGNSTTAGTINIGTGAVATGTKAINIGTGTVAPGVCTMVFGTAGVGGNITFNGNGTFNVANNNVQIHSNTATSSVGIGVGATVAAATKTVNIGTGGVASSTTNINLGTVDGGAATVTTNALLVTRASATTGSGLRVTPGVAPTSPVNGDVWTDTAGIYARINGATQTLTPPTAATVAEAKLGNDTAKFINCNVLQKVVNSPSYYKFPRGIMSTATSGTGAAVTAGALITWLQGTTTGAGWAQHEYYGFAGVDILNNTGWQVGTGQGMNFGKQFRLTGSTNLLGPLATNTIVRCMFGKQANDAGGDPTTPCIGWRYNQATGFIEIIAHNGTSLVTLTTASNPVTAGWFEWELYNNGSGSVQMFVNDVSVGTLTGGPSGGAFSAAPTYVEEIQTTATPSGQPSVRFRNGGLFLQP